MPTTDTYSTAGSFTWTAPANVTSVQAECWGGGGGGSRDGGGGGAYSKKTISVTPGNNYTVRVAAAGVALTSGGGDSWFSTSSTVLAKGGELGNDGETTNGLGGAAASGIGDVKYSGGNGALIDNAGGGGSSAGTAAAGTSTTTGAGAIAPTGGGDGGSGSVSGTATAGTSPGGGGGGTILGTAANGAVGKVVLTYTAGSPAPVAAFSGTPTSGTAPLSVAFTDSSTNSPTSWLWEKSSDGGSNWSNFDSGHTSQNPIESFTAGTWAVRLTATNAGGSDAETKTAYITVTAARRRSLRIVISEEKARRLGLI